MGEAAQWRPYDEQDVRILGLPQEIAELLTGPGLPVDCHRMFVRDPALDLQRRDLPCGSAVYLGAIEDGYNTLWLVPGTGEIWLARAYETPGVPQFALANSSLAGLSAVLRLWDEFLRSGRSEEDADYDEYVADVLEHAHLADPGAFWDENAWWARVFEEVELGVLGPY